MAWPIQRSWFQPVFLGLSVGGGQGCRALAPKDLQRIESLLSVNVNLLLRGSHVL